LIITILLTVSVGGHWVLLQSVGWVTMVLDYSKDAPLAVAVAKTFDGKHPCKICKLVKNGRQNEQKPDVIKPKFKLDSCLLAHSLNFESSPAVAEHISFRSIAFHSFGDSPPVPPPRLA
jgi:hypothetical protein